MLAHGRPPGSLYTSAGQRKYLTSAERVRFLERTYACPRDDLKSLCLTLAFTGCRISEALELAAGSIECDAGFIAIRSLKKRAGAVVYREVPAPAELFGVLRQVHGLEDLNARLWQLSRCRAWQLIKGIMRQAAIPAGPHATPKGLRHSFGLHAIRSGVPLNLVQRWLGHASMNTTAIYLQAIGDEEREIASRMWRD